MIACETDREPLGLSCPHARRLSPYRFAAQSAHRLKQRDSGKGPVPRASGRSKAEGLIRTRARCTGLELAPRPRPLPPPRHRPPLGTSGLVLPARGLGNHRLPDDVTVAAPRGADTHQGDALRKRRPDDCFEGGSASFGPRVRAQCTFAKIRSGRAVKVLFSSAF